MSTRPWTRAAAAGAATLLALTACGGSDDAGGETGEGGLTAVTIGTQPIVDSAPLYLGVDQGFFEEERLDLTIETAVGGAAVVPSVVSGDFEFGRGNVLSTMIAVSQGLPLRCITNANSTAGNPDFGAVVVLGDSPLQSMADLSGRTVSVNTLNNIGDTTIRSVVEEAGGDPQAVQFVEIPFPDAPAALQSGQVDAAWILDPFLTEAVDAGGRVLSYNFSDFHPQLDISCVFTSEQLIQEQPEVVEAFQRAMNRSLEFSQANPDEVRRITGTYTEIDPAVLERIVIPTFRPDFNREAMELLGAKAAEYGSLPEEPDLDQLLP
ncbi:ABC transporter substrate-binding protein [Geodermatophilus sabuli]|uniref:NitT/TauT family transport system substrate-binding protein n=1 Tax=Geodermatophilus sabuli TaxID=1564158 RepID=A0A285E6Q2_9ACTN|nr:ABC transporter substrate-binding protein [Geodermatophilus sabuli]MBB3082342.1 NitT/TauT family transport system substrate-binding protein [Geodermatophilus sabuli]SNX94788.1 NitT/TauT family transport system substrate-binding protein [Geodermatophilus sabuli]